MKKSQYLIIAVFLGLTFILSACVPGPRTVGSPGLSVSDENVFVSYSSFVYSLDITTGSVDWHFPDEADNQVVFYAPPLVTDEFVYVGDLANNFHKIDIETGQAQWTFSGAKGIYIGQAAVEGGTVYAPSNDGSLYAINADGELLWSFETGHYIWSQPQLTADGIYFGSMDHFVYGLSKNGDQLWSVEMGGAVVGSPVLSEDGTVLYVGSVGNEMVALDTSTGDLLWALETQESVWGRGILAEETLYFADSGGTLYALDPDDGEPIWQTEFAGSVVGGLTAIADGFVLATEDGVVKAFNFDGSPKWESSLAGEIFQAPDVNDEFILTGTVNGENLVYAFNLSGVQLWSTTPEN